MNTNERDDINQDNELSNTRVPRQQQQPSSINQSAHPHIFNYIHLKASLDEKMMSTPSFSSRLVSFCILPFLFPEDGITTLFVSFSLHRLIQLINLTPPQLNWIETLR